MTQAKLGDTVRVHYTGKLSDGTVFDTSSGRDPLQFTIGEAQVIPGFEKAVVGMDLGESRSAEIAVSQAYGPRDEGLVMTVGKDQIPQDMQIEINGRLQVRQPDGEALVVTVTGISEDGVTLDGNHPLAGQDLTFDIELVEIV